METPEKKYIFITSNISNMGGAQNYVRSKIKYLIREGWRVYIFFQGNNATKCAFEELDDYLDGNIVGLHTLPDQIYGTIGFYMILFKMLKHIEYTSREQCCYFIETHFEYVAIWGEILAPIVSAKHIFFNLQENVRVMGSLYSDYIDFFKYKFERRELAGIHEDSIHCMFEGYMDVAISDEYRLIAQIEDNVRDIDSTLIEQLADKDWNIAYFGRCNKGYFPYILYEIRLFCRKHSTKKIHFVIVGALQEAEKELVDRLNDLDNLTISCLSYFNPIPINLFQKMDVMIAGSGCAVLAYKYGATVIVPNADHYTAAGIFGYTTGEALYGDKDLSYVELLEDVLITKKYLNNTPINIHYETCEESYDKFWKFVSKSSPKRDYYMFGFQERSSLEGGYIAQFLKDFLELLKKDYEERLHFVEWVSKQFGTKIALFGYGLFGKKIVEDIPELSYQIILDNKAVNNDSRISVVSPTKEVLQKIDTIFISPIKLVDNIIEELRNKQFKGKCFSFVQIVTEYLHMFLRENFNYK